MRLVGRFIVLRDWFYASDRQVRPPGMMSSVYRKLPIVEFLLKYSIRLVIAGVDFREEIAPLPFLLTFIARNLFEIAVSWEGIYFSCGHAVLCEIIN